MVYRWAMGWKISVLAGAGNFSLHHCIQTGSGPHSAYPRGYQQPSLGVKWARHEDGHSLPPSAVVQ